MKKLYIIFIYAVIVSVIIIILIKRGTAPELEGEISYQPEPTIEPEYQIGILEPVENFIPVFSNVLSINSMEDIQKYLYTIDETAYVHRQDLDLEAFVNRNLKTELNAKEPKILIFHTHSQEDYIDSRKGEVSDTVVGMGTRLAEVLVNKFKIPVVHDVGSYDMQNGKVARGSSYERMEPAIKKILEKYPSIEVIIDLHRDGVPDDVHLVTDINGKQTAKIMFFNGVSCENKNGQPKDIPGLFNPNLFDNMALSLQLHLTSNELFPGFARRIYIKPYRYSLHLMPKSMLVELGANTNTVSEAASAIEPLAEIIVRTLDVSE